MYEDVLQPVRVIEEGDVRIFHASVRFRYGEGDNLHVCNPIPVYEDGREIGVANVYLDEGKVVAFLFINYASPARLLTQIDESYFGTLYFITGKDGANRVQWLQLTRQPLGGDSAKLVPNIDS